jgi:hypothetical protein
MAEAAIEQAKSTVLVGDPRDQASQLGALVMDLRSRRRTVESRWIDFHQAWRGIKTRSFFKSEVFSTFIPYARRAIEKNVIKLCQMLLPSPEFFEVYPGAEYDDQAGKQAESVRAYMLYLFAKRIRIKSIVGQLGRSYYLYGRAVAKTGVRVEYVGTMPEVWPTLRAVDPFTFYTWPETVASIDDAEVVAEDHRMPWDVFKAHMDAGRLMDVPPIRELVEPDWPWYLDQRLGTSGFSTPGMTSGSTDKIDENKKPPKFLAITEVWYREDGRWVMCWLLWNCASGPKIVRRFDPELGRHPYRMAVARQLPGEQYTTGLMDDLEPLQVLAADQWDMTLEGQATSFAPIAVIDPMFLGRSAQFKYTPRAKWFAPTDGVKFLEAPDTAKSGYMGIQATTSLIESFSADNPISNGMPMRGMPRAGFAVSSMMNLAMADIKDAAQTFEDELLTPVMGDLFANTVLYVPDDQKFRIPGTKDFPGRTLTPMDLAGDYDFRWVGSLQSQDMQVRSQRLITTLQVLGKMAPTVQQDLAGKGKKVNWEALYKRVWRDGLGERGADNIIIDMTPEEIEAMKAAQNKPEPPKVSVSVKGEIDPILATELAAGVPPGSTNPVPPTTPEALKGTEGGGQTTKAPASEADMGKRISRNMAEKASS